MKAEFLKDDLGNIWFSFASNIETREVFGKSILWKNDKKSVDKSLERDRLLNEIDQHKAQYGEDSDTVRRMATFMNGYYE